MANSTPEVDCFGIPRNIDDLRNYGFNKWNKNRWKWEFLRRRDDYRKSFKKARDSLSKPPPRPAEVTDDLLNCYAFDDWPFEHEGAREFGLSHFFDPRQSDWVAMGPDWTDSGLVSAASGQMVLEWHHVPFVFDVRKPIKPQLIEAERLLSETARLCDVETPRKPPEHPAKWPHYLVALDARARGESYREIDARLPEGLGSARDVLKAARTLFWG